jgi:YD repeat-containing protein
MVRILVLLLAIFAFQALLSPRAAAQGSNCDTVQTQFCFACGDPILPGQHGCISEAPFILICLLPDWHCPPAAGPTETRSTKCPTCSPSDPQASSPVDLASGNAFIEETDIRMPGLNGGLSLARTWNSTWPSMDSAYQIGMFGPNWRSTYEERVFVGSDYYFKYLRSDGSIWSFGYGPGKPAKFSSAAMVLATPVSFGGPKGAAALNPAQTGYGVAGGAAGSGGAGGGVYIAPTYFTIYFGDGTSKRFLISTGQLMAIIDRNGNATTMSYDSLNRLTTVTDPASRHLNFYYGTGTGSLVTSVTTDDPSYSTSYSYDLSGRLTQVTEPDSSTISFDYDSNSLISSVLDSDGHVLEAHTYDSTGRALTSSQAGGVNAVTLTY